MPSWDADGSALSEAAGESTSRVAPEREIAEAVAPSPDASESAPALKILPSHTPLPEESDPEPGNNGESGRAALEYAYLLEAYREAKEAMFHMRLAQGYLDAVKRVSGARESEDSLRSGGQA
jgi:hypothetical protein